MVITSTNKIIKQRQRKIYYLTVQQKAIIACGRKEEMNILAHINLQRYCQVNSTKARYFLPSIILSRHFILPHTHSQSTLVSPLQILVLVLFSLDLVVWVPMESPKGWAMEGSPIIKTKTYFPINYIIKQNFISTSFYLCFSNIIQIYIHTNNISTSS